jgi:hypothetical protein
VTTDLSLAADPAVIERAADPGEYVIQACRQALALLRDALEHGGIDQIAEIKSQAEAVRVYTVQKQLGVDAQLAATEIVRRADRGIGIAVRRGQESGEIRKPHENNGPRSDYTRSGKPVHVDLGNDESKVSPGGKTSPAFYAGTGQSRADIYAMTDGVSDEEFEDVLAEAKAEQNLSRNNVVGKIRQRKARQERAAASRDDGEQVPEPRDRSSAAAARRAELIGRWAGEGSTSRQIAGLLGIRDDAVRRIAREHAICIRADEIVGRTRRPDSNRIVRETASALEGLAMGAELVNPSDLDKAEVPGWAGSITASLRALSQLAKTLKEEMTDD